MTDMPSKPDYKNPLSLSAQGVYDAAFFDRFLKKISMVKGDRKEFEKQVVGAALLYLNMKENNTNPRPNWEQNELLKPVIKKAIELKDSLEKLSQSVFATAKLYSAFKEQAEKNDDTFETHFAKALLVSRDHMATYDSDSVWQLICFLENSARRAKEITLGREGGDIGDVLGIWIDSMRSVWKEFFPNEIFAAGRKETNRTPDLLHDIIQKIDPDITLENIFTALRKKRRRKN